MDSAGEKIKKKLNAFIRKYYWNEIIKGSIFLVVLMLSMALVIGWSEWILYASGDVRMAFFIGFIAIAGVLFVWKIGNPLLKLLKLRKGLSDEKAAVIIGEHFAEIDDKLLNLIQLKRLKEQEGEDFSLLDESIEQKSKALSFYPFTETVSYKSNVPGLLKYWPVFLLFLVFIVFFPSGFTGSVERVIHYKNDYERPMPFRFVLLNDSLGTEQNSSFEIRMKTEGEFIPDKVYLQTDQEQFLMSRQGATFTYTLPPLSSNTTFFFKSGKVVSTDYLLKVFPLPVILEFELFVEPPAYTGLAADTLKNNGDVFVAEGSDLQWNFYTTDVSQLNFLQPDTVYTYSPEKDNVISVNRKLNENLSYSVVPGNKHLISKDTLNYSINVIKDQYPEITVDQIADSLLRFRKYFTGTIGDDYGFTSVRFICKAADTVIFIDEIGHTANTKQRFFYSYDFNQLRKKYEEVLFYFGVTDNDRVNGPKTSYSAKRTLRFPTEQELKAEKERQNTNIKSSLEKELKEASELSEKIRKLRERVINEGEGGWKDKQELKSLMDEFEQLLKQQKKLQKEIEANRKFEDKLTDTDKRLLKKQEQLEELMKEVMDEEMKKMMEELRKMMEELDKEKMNDALENMEMNSGEMEKRLDRTLELFKQLEFEKNLDAAINQADSLSQKQSRLNEKAKNARRNDLDSLSKDQKGLKDELDSLNKELNELQEQNKKLEKPNQFNPPEEDIKKAGDDMEQSEQELQKNNRRKANQKMQDAQKQLESISLQLKMQQQQMQEENLAEDIDNLKQILENLIYLSYEQETLMEKFTSINRNDPSYVERIQDQFQLLEKLGMVEDSLIALSKRQAMIKNFVMEELKNVTTNMERSIEYLNERNVSTGVSRQQYSMMHINNLALMLSEALKNMQSSLNASGSGKGQPKPGQGKPKMSEIRKMQQKLQQQMQQMKEGMGKPGQKPGQMSEKLARMAAQQAEIRRKLQQYRQELMKQGKGDQGLNKSLKNMEENETDLVNKRITEELIERQKEIITRLLKSEKAEREQEKQEKREAETADDWDKSSPDALEFEKMIEQGRDILKSIPPEMNPYYKKKVNEYFLDPK